MTEHRPLKKNPLITPLVNFFRGYFTLLLISMVLLFYGIPLLGQTHGGSLILELFFWFVILSGVHAVAYDRPVHRATAWLAATYIATSILHLFVKNFYYLLFLIGIETVLLSLTAFAIIVHIMRKEEVTGDHIAGAVCGYLLIGIIFALIYTVLELVHPGSFSFANKELATWTLQPAADKGDRTELFQSLMYFSYVTMASVGYGDITPTSHLARNIACTQTIMGQFYMAVLVARLVGLHIGHSRTKNAHHEGTSKREGAEIRPGKG